MGDPGHNLAQQEDPISSTPKIDSVIETCGNNNLLINPQAPITPEKFEIVLDRQGQNWNKKKRRRKHIPKVIRDPRGKIVFSKPVPPALDLKPDNRDPEPQNEKSIIFYVRRKNRDPNFSGIPALDGAGTDCDVHSDKPNEPVWRKLDFEHEANKMVGPTKNSFNRLTLKENLKRICLSVSGLNRTGKPILKRKKRSIITNKIIRTRTRKRTLRRKRNPNTNPRKKARAESGLPDLEQVILQLEKLDLNSCERAIVPYMGSTDKLERERIRLKVVLDEYTIQEWNLLTNKESASSAGGVNETDEADKKEEYWRKERSVFESRARYFIARMKLIQGDRQFSEWKGSVVDSVVGAFLTQNVGDHLSSSAFISLASRFPLQPKCKGRDLWMVNKFTESEFSWGSTSLNITTENMQSNEIKMDDPISKEGTGDSNGTQRRKGYKKGTENFDWDSWRREVSDKGYKRESRRVEREDSVDWEAVRRTREKDISDTIQDRGMNNKLAKRIQEFLNRLAEDHGGVDLEWLREIPPDNAKEFLLSIYGLGLKSVECVRLLTLHHVAFPVDTNVGRVFVRLGWVPLQPLPESLQLHLLELYPIRDSIQKYLWPRLCKLDQRTLYELHYHMITFGKVFCTKSKPNCNACPLRSDCKHFASAFASARLQLPGPESSKSAADPTNLIPIPILLQNRNDSVFNNLTPRFTNTDPIVEEPTTPQQEEVEEKNLLEEAEEKKILEEDHPMDEMEDLFWEEPEEIPAIDMNMEALARNVMETCFRERKDGTEIRIEDISKALVILPPEAASIPVPRFRNPSSLRTVHPVYELPDTHPLLKWLEFEKRESDDPSPYLLKTWMTDGDNLCGDSCKGTFLIPCRTAMRGSFPLNGTYFQVNEVFADHHSSRNPVTISKQEICNLHTRMVYFGTSVQTIFRGLTTEETQNCFWRGFVCVREFDRVMRSPRPLSPLLHTPPSKKKPENKNRNGIGNEKMSDDKKQSQG